MRAKKSMRKTSKEVDEKRRSRQTKSKRANTGADLESETMEISRVVSAIMAAAEEEEEEEADDITQDDDKGTSDAESTSYAVDGMSCVDYDDDDIDDDIDENSAHESDDSFNQDDDDDVSTRESDSDDDESDEAPENESADDNKASSRSRRALLPSSTKRLGRKGKLAGQHDKSKSKNKSKKWGLKRLLGPKQRADAKVFALEGNDDDLSSSSPASVSNADDYTRSQSHVSSVVQDNDHTILGGDTAEDNTILCTASRVSIIEDVSTAPGGYDGDEESTVAFEISTTFPGATSFIRGLGLGPKLLGYGSADDDKEEEEDVIKDKNGNALGVIEEEEVDDKRNAPTSPPLSITVSQRTDHDGPTSTGATSNANLNASIGIAPLTTSDRTTSECRRPIGSPEKISIQREDSNINAGDVLVPKRVPFKSLGRMPNKATKSPPKRKPRRDHVIVSVFSSDTGPSKPARCATSSPNPMCADASSEDDWYNCDTNGSIAIVPATEEDGTWTANFDEAFGSREPDGQKDCDLDDDNSKVENTQPTSSSGSLPSTGTVGPVLEQTNPSTQRNRKSKDLPPSPTSVITASDGKNTNKEAHTDEQDAIPDVLKKQVDELDQLISKMSYDMKLLSSIITEQQGQEQSITQPISPEIGDSVRHRSLADDIVDDIEEKGESNEIMTHAVDSNVEVPLEIAFFVGPSKTKDYDLSDDLSIKPTVAMESVPVNVTTDRASESKPNNDEFTKKSSPRAPTSLLSKLFKSRKSPKSSSRSKNASLPLRTKRSVFFRRSNKPHASRDADDSSVACAEQSVADTVLPTPEKSETFGDAFLSTANALLDQAADYAFPPEDDEAEVVGNKKRSKAKKTQKKKEEKVKAKKTSSNLIKSKSRSMSRSSSKKRSTFFLKHKNDRSDRICRIFGDCTDLYNDICNFQELSCMYQDFLCDAQDEATLAVCRVDYAVKKSIRNFGEQCIAIADD